MITSIKEYIEEKTSLFSAFDEYLPQLEKIEKANQVWDKLLDKINSSLESFDETAFFEIDDEQIKTDLKIDLDQDIKKEHLVEIFDEIEKSFALQGRVSLEEYMQQSNLIYMGLQNDLMGTIDYSIEYSEEELQKREKLMFERFAMLSSMNNILIACENDGFELSLPASNMLAKSQEILDKIPRTPVIETVEEQISDLNYTLLAIEELSTLKCTSKDLSILNSALTEKFANVMENVAEYSSNESIINLYRDLRTTVEGLNELDSNFGEIYQESQRKLNIIDEAIFGRVEKSHLEV